MSTQLLRNGLSGIFIVESIQLGLLENFEAFVGGESKGPSICSAGLRGRVGGVSTLLFFFFFLRT